MSNTMSGVALCARVRAVSVEVAALVGALDAALLAPDAVGGAEAAALAVALAGVERLAGAGKTLAAGRVAESGYHRALGFPTAARWLAAATGVGGGEASRALATAAHLGDEGLAATRAAFVSGVLTQMQAGEISRTAAGAPGEQERLLGVAACETPARLRDECRRVRLAGKPAEDPEARRKRLAAEMAFGARDLGDGMGELFARMPSSWLTRVLAAVREQCDAIFDRARAEGRTDPHAAYMVEALVTLLLIGNLGGSGAGDAGGDDGNAGDVGGEAGGGGDDGGDADVDLGDDGGEAEVACEGGGFDDPVYRQLLASLRGESPPAPPPRAERRRRRRGRCSCGGRVVPRAKIIVRVDQAALMRGAAEAGEMCDIAGVGPVAVSTVRELWPDAVVRVVVTRGVDVVNVTSLGRRATAAMETAMQWSMPRCTNIACDNDRFVEVDHRLGFANVHRTRLDELDLLCKCCHHLKTVENWQLEAGSGRRRFLPPGHADHPAHPPTPVRRRPPTVE